MNDSIRVQRLQSFLKGNRRAGNRALAVLIASASMATANAQVEEVIVTATKRSENIQDVPVSITALSADALEAYGISSGSDVTNFVPNFSLQSTWGPSGPAFMAIRGINYVDFNFINEMPVGTYVDEVYMGSQTIITGQLFDQERVEVLRGPQGTLFGRNTTAGAVHFISRKPTDEFGGYAHLQTGSFDQRVFEGAIGGPITDRFRTRIAAKLNRDDGFQKNEVTGTRWGKADVSAVRATAQLDLSEALMAEASIHHVNDDSDIAGAFGLGKRDPATGLICERKDIQKGRCVTTSGFRHGSPEVGKIYSQLRHLPNHNEGTGGYLKLSWDLGWSDMTAISGAEKSEGFLQSDIKSYDDPVADIGSSYDYEHSQFSQEIRFNGETEKLKWVAGLYYYEDKRKAHSDILINNAPIPSSFDATTETTSYAIFGQTDYAITDRLAFVTGLRVTDDKRELTRFTTTAGFNRPDLVPAATDTSVTGTAALEFRPDDDVMLYAKYSRGFKSGGYNVDRNLSNAGAANVGPVKPEEVSSYEVGARTEWFDKKLRANVTFFYIDFQQLQTSATVAEPATGLFTATFFNMDQADIYGSEIELSLKPSQTWDMDLGVGLLHTKISDSSGAGFTSDLPGSAPRSANVFYPLDGSRLPAAPEANINAAIRYHHSLNQAGVITFQVDGRYQSKVYFGADNNPIETQDAYGIVNFRVRWLSDSERYTAEAFVTNATKETYSVHGFDSGADYAYLVGGDTRRVGVQVGVNF